eukprot:PITA_07818
MMRNHEASGRPPLFDGTNFGFWKKRMTYYLMSLGPKVWHFVHNEYQIPPTLLTNQDERKAYIANAKALNSITSGITDSEFTKVRNCNSAKEMWDKLVGLYDGDSKVKKAKLQTHRRQFESLKMEDEEDISSYFPRVAEVVNSLKGLDEKIEESTIVQKVLRSLPDRFDSKISAIEEAKDLDTLKMDELHGILTTYEMRKGGPNSKDAAFKASKSTKGKERNDCSDDSDVESELAQFVQKLKRGSKLKGKNPLIYFKCGKIGHYAAKCPHKHDSDDEVNSKRRVYKKKGTNMKNFFSKQDESNEDEFVVIKRKSDEESDHDESQETLFMAFTNEDDSGLEGNVDELLISVIEENEKLRNKIISQVGIAVYTLNRTQLRPNCEKTPYELWKGRPASVKYFKIFGSKCFIKINDGSPGKFDSRVDEGIFLGYSTRSKAYKCYNFRLKKIVESIDVKIDEDLPEKEIEDHEDDLLIEEEEPKEEEIDQEEEEEEKEPPYTSSKMKFI